MEESHPKRLEFEVITDNTSVMVELPEGWVSNPSDYNMYVVLLCFSN